MQNSILLSDITGGIAVMEAATMADNMGVRRLRSNVFRIENEGFPTIQEQAVEAKGILKSLAPIINNLRLFGLYFTYKEPADCEIATDQSQQLARRCSRWSFSRIHATVILVVMWLNTARYVFIFDGQETLGAHLFVKLGIIAAGTLNTAFQTAYYAASHTGSLNRVLRHVDLSVADVLPKYSWRAKLITAICWLYITWNMIHYGYQVFVHGRHNDFALIILNRSLPECFLNVMKAVFVLVQLQILGTWTFSQAMNFMVIAVLYDQFNRLSEEFSECIGDRGEFSGNFDQFRQRHQAISRSVQEADRFLMITNGANLSGHIVSIILVFFSLVFFRGDTVAFHPESAVLYIAWLSVSVFSLSLSAGQAIYLNHTESILHFILTVSLLVMNYCKC